MGQSVVSNQTILVQSELCSEVNPLHVLIRGEAVRRAAPKDYTVMDDVGTIRDPQRFPHVMVGDEDPDPALLQVEDDFLDVGDGDRVDAGKGFIEQDELG